MTEHSQGSKMSLEYWRVHTPNDWTHHDMCRLLHVWKGWETLDSRPRWWTNTTYIFCNDKVKDENVCILQPIVSKEGINEEAIIGCICIVEATSFLQWWSLERN